MGRSIAIIHYDDVNKQFYAIVPDSGSAALLEQPLVKITSGPAVGGTGDVVGTDGVDVSWGAAPFPVGAALTKVDDTNVTVTLGGSPANALLNAASLTMGWNGQLAVARGGTGVASSTGTGSVVLNDTPTLLTPVIASFVNALHAAIHKHGGIDEISTSVAGANLIPKAQAGGTLHPDWLGTGVRTGTKYLRDDGTWQTVVGAAGSATSVSIAFTDGDTVRRTSIADAAILATDKIITTIQRPNKATDADDDGLVYLVNTVRVYAGGFDVVIVCLDRGGMDPTEKPPNETISLLYTVFA